MNGFKGVLFAISVMTLCRCELQQGGPINDDQNSTTLTGSCRGEDKLTFGSFDTLLIQVCVEFHSIVTPETLLAVQQCQISAPEIQGNIEGTWSSEPCPTENAIRTCPRVELLTGESAIFTLYPDTPEAGAEELCDYLDNTVFSSNEGLIPEVAN